MTTRSQKPCINVYCVHMCIIIWKVYNQLVPLDMVFSFEEEEEKHVLILKLI